MYFYNISTTYRGKETMNSIIRNPKRDILSRVGKSGFFNYYASFSPGFVSDIIKYLRLKEGSLIMDPWNGSGTTTQVAQEMGYASIGYDINPAMVIVAKAKKLDPDVTPSLVTLCLDIVNKAKRYKKYPLADYEPLETWFFPNTAAVIRNIERAIQNLLISEKYCYLYFNNKLMPISNLAAFFYVAMFRSLKALICNFRSTNPTWVKKPKNEAERVFVSSDDIYNLFQEHVVEMTKLLLNSKRIVLDTVYNSLLDIADSKEIPLPDDSIEAVISSPPYCTRIDYAVATCLELALLGCNYQEQLKNLRAKTIGSPIIINEELPIQENWGKTCINTINRIFEHETKASKSYYYKTYIQYFGSIYRSLKEINRTLKNIGSCALVVQDSFYKDVHVDLPSIFIEMGETFSWDVKLREDYQIKQTMVGINSKSNRYRNGVVATESVLVFQKTAIGGDTCGRRNRFN